MVNACAQPGVKLYFHSEPDALDRDRQCDFCRTWHNQTEVTVRGIHYVQEDSAAKTAQRLDSSAASAESSSQWNIIDDEPVRKSKTIATAPLVRGKSNPDAFDFLRRKFLAGTVVELGGPRRFVRGDLLRVLQRAAILHIGGDTGRAKCVAAGGIG